MVKFWQANWVSKLYGIIMDSKIQHTSIWVQAVMLDSNVTFLCESNKILLAFRPVTYTSKHKTNYPFFSESVTTLLTAFQRPSSQSKIQDQQQLKPLVRRSYKLSTILTLINSLIAHELFSNLCQCCTARYTFSIKEAREKKDARVWAN